MDEQMRDLLEANEMLIEIGVICRDQKLFKGSYAEIVRQAFAALSQPAAQGGFIGESVQVDFEYNTWTFEMQPGYESGAGFYRITYIGLTASRATP